MVDLADGGGAQSCAGVDAGRNGIFASASDGRSVFRVQQNGAGAHGDPGGEDGGHQAVLPGRHGGGADRRGH